MPSARAAAPLDRLGSRAMSSAGSAAATPDERLQRYAELAVRVGANVQPGQEVVVLCQVEHVGDRARGRPRGVPRRRHARRSSATPTSTSAAPRSSSAPRRCSASRPQHLARWVRALARDAARADPAHGRRRARSSSATSTRRSSARSEPHDLRAVYLPLVVGAPDQLGDRRRRPTRAGRQTVFGEPDLERLWDAVADGDAPRRATTPSRPGASTTRS